MMPSALAVATFTTSSKCVRPLDRKVRRLRALDDPVGVVGRASPVRSEARAERHQRAGLHVLAQGRHRRQLASIGEVGDGVRVFEGHAVPAKRKRIRLVLGDGRERAFHRVGIGDVDRLHLHLHFARSRANLREACHVAGIARVPEDRHAREPRYELAQQAEPLRPQLVADARQAGTLPVGPREARDQRLSSRDRRRTPSPQPESTSWLSSLRTRPNRRPSR